MMDRADHLLAYESAGPKALFQGIGDVSESNLRLYFPADLDNNVLFDFPGWIGIACAVEAAGRLRGRSGIEVLP